MSDKNKTRMIFGAKTIGNTTLGAAGWALANAPTMFEHIQGGIAVISSLMGLAMLVISIRTGIVNYRMKKMDLEERKKKAEQNQSGENAN